jgi:hypothetical protein
MNVRKAMSFTEDQLFMVLDALEGFDASFHYEGDEKQIKKIDDLYKRFLKAYRSIQD